MAKTKEEIEAKRRAHKTHIRNKRLTKAIEYLDAIKKESNGAATETQRIKSLTRNPLINILLRLSEDELHELLFEKDMLSQYPDTALELLRLKTHPDTPQPDFKDSKEERLNNWKQWAKERNIGKK